MTRKSSSFIKNDLKGFGKSPVFYLLFCLTMFVLSVFFFRLMLQARFDNVVTTDNYFVYNATDNQINNLDNINASAEGLFNFLRNIPTHFQEIVEKLSEYNVFEAAASQTKDIWLIGAFLNFMSQVWTFIIYIVAMLVSAIQCLLDLFKYIFSIESITQNTTSVIIPDVG